MPTIKIRNEEGEVVEEEITSRRAVLVEITEDEPDFLFEGLDQLSFTDVNVILEPAVPQRIEWDHEGEMSNIMTNCGETENRRQGNKGPELTFEGIITEDQLDSAKTINQGDNVTLVSDIHQGPVEVRRATIEQNNDIISFKEDGGGEKLAFPFQLQLKQPEA